MALRERIRRAIRASSPRYDGAVIATLSGIVDRLRDRTPPLTLGRDERLDGRTALVTGANRGLGLAITVDLVARGAHVIMACRSGIPEVMDVVRREATRRAQEIGGHVGTVDAVKLDLGDLAQTRSVADELAEDGVSLDVVILNAGIVTQGARRSRDGFDEMFQVNFLANVLFVEQLLTRGVVESSWAHDPAPTKEPATEARPRPRVVFVSSESHRSARPLDIARVGDFVPYGLKETVTEYGYHKLVLETWAAWLARELDGEVSVHTFCPGAVATDIAREAPSWAKPLLGPTMRLLFKKPADGAVPGVWLACSRAIEGKSGLYVHVKRVRPRAEQADDPQIGRALAAECDRLLAPFRPAPPTVQA